MTTLRTIEQFCKRHSYNKEALKTILNRFGHISKKTTISQMKEWIEKFNIDIDKIFETISYDTKRKEQSMHIEGERQYVSVAFTPPPMQFIIPRGLDLNDKTRVEKWEIIHTDSITNMCLIIEYVDGRFEVIESDYNEEHLSDYKDAPLIVDSEYTKDDDEYHDETRARFVSESEAKVLETKQYFD